MLEKLNKRKKYLLALSGIILLGLVLFLILIKLTSRLTGTDDTIFQKQILPYHTLIDWVIYRYRTWSGRIFAESFVYIFSSAPLYFWKIASIGLYAVFSAMTFLYYRLFYGNRNKQKDFIMLALAFCLPFLMDTDVIRFGMFWVTGSMNYFWIVTFGLLGFYPIAYYVARHRLPHWAIVVSGILASIIAACSEEQVGMVLVGLSFAFLLYELYMYKKKEHPITTYLIISTIIIFVSFLVSILSPGDAVRLKAETLHWQPDFYTIALPKHIEYAYRWFLEAIVNRMGVLLTISWGLLALLFIKKDNKTRLQNIVTYLLVIFFLVTLFKSYLPVGYWFNFYATWKPKLPNLLSYVTFIPWLFAFIVTVAAPIILFGKKIKGSLFSVLFLAVFASTGLLTLSPTMYASGLRTLFVPSVILLLVVYLLTSEVIDKYTKYKYLLATIFITIAMFGYVYLAMRLAHNLIV
jgi:hypothetical protein